MQRTQNRFIVSFSCYVDQATTKRICDDPDITDGKLVTDYGCFPERAAPRTSSPRVVGENDSTGLITLVDPSVLVLNHKP